MAQGWSYLHICKFLTEKQTNVMLLKIQFKNQHVWLCEYDFPASVEQLQAKREDHWEKWPNLEKEIVSEGSEEVQHLCFVEVTSYHLFKFNTINLIERDILTERRHKCNILSLCESSSVTERERNANKNTYFSVSFSHAQTTQRKRSMATVICTKYHPCSSTTLLMTDSSCQVIDT